MSSTKKFNLRKSSFDFDADTVRDSARHLISRLQERYPQEWDDHSETIIRRLVTNPDRPRNMNILATQIGMEFNKFVIDHAKIPEVSSGPTSTEKAAILNHFGKTVDLPTLNAAYSALNVLDTIMENPPPSFKQMLNAVAPMVGKTPEEVDEILGSTVNLSGFGALTSTNLPVGFDQCSRVGRDEEVLVNNFSNPAKGAPVQTVANVLSNFRRWRSLVLNNLPLKSNPENFALTHTVAVGMANSVKMFIASPKSNDPSPMAKYIWPVNGILTDKVATLFGLKCKTHPPIKAATLIKSLNLLDPWSVSEMKTYVLPESFGVSQVRFAEGGKADEYVSSRKQQDSPTVLNVFSKPQGTEPCILPGIWFPATRYLLHGEGYSLVSPVNKPVMIPHERVRSYLAILLANGLYGALQDEQLVAEFYEGGKVGTLAVASADALWDSAWKLINVDVSLRVKGVVRNAVFKEGWAVDGRIFVRPSKNFPWKQVPSAQRYTQVKGPHDVQDIEELRRELYDPEDLRAVTDEKTKVSILRHKDDVRKPFNTLEDRFCQTASALANIEMVQASSKDEDDGQFAAMPDSTFSFDRTAGEPPRVPISSSSSTSASSAPPSTSMKNGEAAKEAQTSSSREERKEKLKAKSERRDKRRVNNNDNDEADDKDKEKERDREKGKGKKETKKKGTEKERRREEKTRNERLSKRGDPTSSDDDTDEEEDGNQEEEEVVKLKWSKGKAVPVGNPKSGPPLSQSEIEAAFASIFNAS